MFISLKWETFDIFRYLGNYSENVGHIPSIHNRPNTFPTKLLLSDTTIVHKEAVNTGTRNAV